MDGVFHRVSLGMREHRFLTIGTINCSRTGEIWLISITDLRFTQITQPFSTFDKCPTTEIHENALEIISDNPLPAATGAIQGYQDLCGLLCILFPATREIMCTFIRLASVVVCILQHVSYPWSLLSEGSMQTTDGRNHGRHKPGRDNCEFKSPLHRVYLFLHIKP